MEMEMCIKRIMKLDDLWLLAFLTKFSKNWPTKHATPSILSQVRIVKGIAYSRESKISTKIALQGRR